MCGRFVQLPLQFPSQVPWPEIADDLMAMTARYNLAPTQRAAVVMGDGEHLAVKKLRWGLLPHWAKDLGFGAKTINARIETVAKLPSYRAAYKAPRRCLIPMSGYYEWRDENGKQPYYITRKDGEMLYAAGLWEPRHSLQPEDEDGSCTVITRDAVEAAALVHDRMPVFLPASMAHAWMTASPEEAMQIMLSAPEPEIEIRKVSRRVNSSRTAGDPTLLEPI